MLKTIKSLSEYEQLYNEYVTEGHVRGYLNLVADINDLIGLRW